MEEYWASHHLMEKVVNFASYLEERMRELEKQSKRNAKTAMEMNESHLCNDEGTTSSCESLADVKVRISEKEVLVIINSEKQKGIMQKILTQLENLQLSVLSSSVLPFGKFTLAITIVAQMGDECNMKVNDIVKSLRQALLK